MRSENGVRIFIHISLGVWKVANRMRSENGVILFFYYCWVVEADGHQMGVATVAV